MVGVERGSDAEMLTRSDAAFAQQQQELERRLGEMELLLQAKEPGVGGRKERERGDEKRERGDEAGLRDDEEG